MSKGTKDKEKSDVEREFEEEMRKEESPEESRLPEETELEREFQVLPEEIKLDPYAEKFYGLSDKTFKTDTELDNSVNEILNEIERDYFFKGLLKKTKRSGKQLLKKGIETFRGVPAFQAAKGITQLTRGNLKGTLSTLAKAALRVREGAVVLPVLGALGFKLGEKNREAWQNFANMCKESFDYLARNLHEGADDPQEASKLASDAFGAAFKKVKSEFKAVQMQKIRRVAEKPVQRRFAAGKPVILALSLACIVLAAGLVATFVIYSPVANEKSGLESQIAEKNNIISSLQTQIQALQSSLSQANSALQAKDNQTNALSAQIANLNEYLLQYQSLNLSSSLLYQQAVNMEAGANVTVWNDVLQFAGYVTVQVQSTSNTTYIEVVYSSYGVNYDDKVTVGLSGAAAFPVLPSQMAIIIGNEETANAVSATVTATYTY